MVPDLEDVCKEYLRILELVKQDKSYETKYNYILIELIDQMTRMYSGGEMKRYWNSPDKDEEYILNRTGYPENAKRRAPFKIRLRRVFNRITGKTLEWIPVVSKYRLGCFMLSGETHKWMYDEYGLSRLMEKIGFMDVCRKLANVSCISNWEKYELEMDNGKEYKPHSLYIEGVK